MFVLKKLVWLFHTDDGSFYYALSFDMRNIEYVLMNDTYSAPATADIWFSISFFL